MSYDIYFYKSKLGTPNLEEAQATLENEETGNNNSFPEIKQKIANALMDFDNSLQSFDFDYEAIAKFKGISIEESKKIFNHIELNTPQAELTDQITIFNNSVSISVPYWYSDDKANAVFEKIDAYAKVIGETAGYFVYDSQVEKVFDPLVENIFGIGIYKNMSDQIKELKNEKPKMSYKKPWWKFW